MTSKKSNTRLLITTGEPAGIGPDLIIKLLQIQHDYDLTVIGDPKLLEQRAKLLSIPAEIMIVTESIAAIWTIEIWEWTVQLRSSLL